MTGESICRPQPHSDRELGRITAWLVANGYSMHVTLTGEVTLRRRKPKPKKGQTAVTETVPARHASDEDIRLHVAAVVGEHPDKAAQVRDRPHSIGWFVGQVMKRIGGAAEPSRVLRLCVERIGTV